MSPCSKCDAKCCRYFGVHIDTPKHKDDFENIRWYLAHKDTAVYIEKRQWYLEIKNKCRYLMKNHRCRVYERRPTICRDHGVATCEHVGEDFAHDRMFHDMKEFDVYLAERFKGKYKF